MPTYDYSCKSCGHEWDAVQRISEDPLTECPKCHAQAAQRLISGGSFILKGGGWYADLYSSTKPSSSSSKEPSSTSSAPSSPPAPAKTGSSSKD